MLCNVRKIDFFCYFCAWNFILNYHFINKKNYVKDNRSSD